MENINHKPSTPLPWVSVKDGIYTVIDSMPPNGKRIGVMKYIDKPADQNAAYIIHAANAYQKLVGALRSLALQCQNSEERFAPTGNDAIALLRDLGEAS